MHLFQEAAVRQLLDLPATFKRGDLTFQQLMASIAAGLVLLTESTNGLMAQTIFQNASDGWIDVWGDLPAILRRTGESDSVYQPRIQNMLLAARDSAVAIELWLQLIENINSVVIENGPTVLGYSVTVPATIPALRYTQILTNLAYVRPAGVPFNVLTTTGGTYLNTVDYLGSTSAPWQGGRVTGSYLASIGQVVGIRPPASTNNQLSALPDLLLTDPTLNPNIATPLTQP